MRLFILAIIFFALLMMFNCKMPKPCNCNNKKTVILYSCDGKIIQQWENTRYWGGCGNMTTFKDDQGKIIRISGTFIISQQQ
jgi:hypothetical protein